MKYPSEKTREKLRGEYHALHYSANKLQWCNEQANKLKLSYGQFVTWLGI